MDIGSLLDKAHVVILWQTPQAVIEEVQPYLFRTRSFFTPLIDLALPEDQLWQALEPKSCRYEIRKAQKMECTVLRNEETDVARDLINESIRRLRYRAELGEEEWNALLPNHDIFLCKWQGTPVAAHVMLLDRPHRARLLLSGSADRSDPNLRNVVGPANRLLHWSELQAYKAEGMEVYDFGGCDTDKKSPEYSITQFKLSFGAKVVEEPMLFLAGNPSLRLLLRCHSGIRAALKSVPWPKRWKEMVRTHPRIASLFR
ncbi:MAG: GNAT family N-acetyltransferase [Verrucomicrobiota bacterium]